MASRYVLMQEDSNIPIAIVKTEDDAMELLVDILVEEMELNAWFVALFGSEFYLRELNEHAIQLGYKSIFDPMYHLCYALKQIWYGEYYYEEVPCLD